MGIFNSPKYTKSKSELELEKQMEEERKKAEQEKKDQEAREAKYKSRVDRGLVGSRSLFTRAGGRGFYTEGKRSLMGAKQSASGGGTSPGESKARVRTTEITGTKNAQKAQSKVIGKRADNYAREQLNIQKIGDAGYRSLNNPYGDTTQMYGAAYNQARGEYLSSLGLARSRQVTDAMGKTRTVYDPRTADGTYTNLSRQSAEEARRNRTPLSKEMYQSQKNTQLALGGLLAMSGVALLPSILFSKSQTPYSDYISKTESSGFYSYDKDIKNNNSTNVMSGDSGEFADETEAQKKQKKYAAGSGQSLSTKERSLFGSSPQTFNV